jgi:hypothetical protein
MPAITPKTDYVTEGVGRLAQQYRGKVNLVALLTAYLDEVQILETAIDGVRSSQTIDGALAIGGAPLDALGALVGQAREGRDDDSYARHIRARIAVNRSQGLVEDILRIARAILPDHGAYAFVLTKHPPKMFALFVDGAMASISEASDLASFIQAGAKAGTQAFLLYTISDPADAFRFDSGPGYDVGRYAGGF